MKSRQAEIVALLVLVATGWTTTAHATADGPDFYAVTDVAVDDVLILRASPSEDAETVGQIAHDAHDLQNLGCQGFPSYGEWDRVTGKERQASRKHYWCKVRYQGVEGWVAGRFLREESDTSATETTGSALSSFGMTCREIAAYQVGVSDNGDIRQEDTSIRETLPLSVDVKLQGGTDTIRMVTIVEQVGDLWREMDGTMEVGIAINADAGHWRLDLEKNLLRRVAVIAGQSARFAIFACERL